mgnify:CR=1 FL=1
MTSKITGTGSLYLKEQAAALAEVGASGQVWVDDATPNTLMFTNDAGTDEQLSGLGYQSVVQVVNVTTGAVATGTTVMPSDDTIPQNNEGIEFMTLAITPKSASNKLKIDVVVVSAVSTTAEIKHALFQDTTAGALASSSEYQTSNGLTTVSFTHYMAAGTTSATTFKVRVGGHTASTLTFNGYGGSRINGGSFASSITITEYTP